MLSESISVTMDRYVLLTCRADTLTHIMPHFTDAILQKQPLNLYPKAEFLQNAWLSATVEYYLRNI